LSAFELPELPLALLSISATDSHQTGDLSGRKHVDVQDMNTLRGVIPETELRYARPCVAYLAL